jgi:DNA-binding response OmpR family regulator
MDLRALLITADKGLADLLRPQVENQGGLCTVAESYDHARASFGWANAAFVDLELPEGGQEALARLRLERPSLPVVAIAARSADAAAVAEVVDRVLLEPFSIAEVVEAVRTLAPAQEAPVVDLRPGAGTGVGAGDDAPWWATR